MKFEVRCCCIPKKLLGWLELPPDYLRRDKVDLTYFEKATVQIPYGGYIEEKVKRIVLPIEDFCPVASPNRFDYRYKAIKAESISIETLRKIPNFTENKNGEFEK